MYIQRILRNAVLAELLLFLMVVNCAPSRPREDVDGSRRIGGAAGRGSAPVGGAFRRIYRFSTGCGLKRHQQSSESITIGDLIRFRPDGSLDAKGLPSDSNVDIQLISVGFGGEVRIYSPSSQLYLCFNKKAKLVTKKKIRADDTLCQFYDTLNHGIRRFVSVYRRRILAGLPAKSDGSSQEDFIPPIPGQHHHHHRNNHVSPGGSQEGDWQVGFSRTGEPLKGAGWRKQPACFDLVDRVDHTTQPTPPLNFQDMLHIFQSEVTTKRATTTTTTVPTTTTLPARRKSSHKTNKRRHHRKHPVNNHKVSNPNNNHQVTTSATAADVNELIPAEVLWPSKNNNVDDDVVSSNRVDFDSYLAETEELIAQAGHPKKEAADGYVNSSQHSGGSSSRFILLDSGGWQEVIIRQPVSPDEQQQQDVTL